MENEKNKLLANRVASLRKKCGLSQGELSEKVYINQRTISNIERGEGCSLQNIMLLVDFFGVSLDYILNRSDIPNADDFYTDKITIEIFTEINEFSKAEKEKLLAHIRLENKLKRNGR